MSRMVKDVEVSGATECSVLFSSQCGQTYHKNVAKETRPGAEPLGCMLSQGLKVHAHPFQEIFRLSDVHPESYRQTDGHSCTQRSLKTRLRSRRTEVCLVLSGFSEETHVRQLRSVENACRPSFQRSCEMLFAGLRSQALSSVDGEEAEITEQPSFRPLNPIFAMLQTKPIDQDQRHLGQMMTLLFFLTVSCLFSMTGVHPQVFMTDGDVAPHSQTPELSKTLCWLFWLLLFC